MNRAFSCENFSSKLAVQGRYKEKPFLFVPTGSYRGLQLRPLPCSYY